MSVFPHWPLLVWVLWVAMVLVFASIISLARAWYRRSRPSFAKADKVALAGEDAIDSPGRFVQLCPSKDERVNLFALDARGVVYAHEWVDGAGVWRQVLHQRVPPLAPLSHAGRR